MPIAIDPAATLVGDLAVRYPAAARIFHRLGIDYCCGGKRSLTDACEARGVPLAEAVAALDAAANEPSQGRDWMQASLPELCDHIVRRHHEPLREELPRLDTLLENEVGDGAGRVDHGCSLAGCGRCGGTRATRVSHRLDGSAACGVQPSVRDRSKPAVDY